MSSSTRWIRRTWALGLLTIVGTSATRCTLDEHVANRCARDGDCLSGRFCVRGFCSWHPEGGASGEAGSAVAGSVGKEAGAAGVSPEPTAHGGEAGSSGSVDGDSGNGGTFQSEAGSSGSPQSGAGGTSSAGVSGSAGIAGGGSSGCGGYMVELPTGRCIDWFEIKRVEYDEFVKLDHPTPDIAGCENNQTFEPGCEWPGFAEALAARAKGQNYDYATIARPATCVDWCDAAAYCAVKDQYLCGNRLDEAVPFEDFADPSKSSWSLACTQAGSTAYPYGASYSAGKCVDYTTNDGARPERTDRDSSCNGTSGNFACIFDLSGNVAEWENSCDGPGEDAACRVRGGSYLDSGADVSCAASATRSRLDNTDPSVGFRCCKAQCR